MSVLPDIFLHPLSWRDEKECALHLDDTYQHWHYDTRQQCTHRDGQTTRSGRQSWIQVNEALNLVAIGEDGQWARYAISTTIHHPDRRAMHMDFQLG